MKTRQLIGIFVALNLMTFFGCGGSEINKPVGSDHEKGETAENDHHDEQPSKDFVELEVADLDLHGIEIGIATSGTIQISTELPGVVQVNGDRTAHVSPRVGGLVREVHVTLGDSVVEGQLLAVLESRELADAKANYLAASERLSLAQATYDREERLWQKKVTSEQEYLDASRDRAESRIEVRRAAQQLNALGFSNTELEQLSDRQNPTLTTYRVTAPFSGTIIDRHITLGETVAAESPVFTVADLSSVWIDLSIYQRDIGTVLAGQSAWISTGHDHIAELVIDYVQPLVGEDTRTALARVVAPNTEGIWHPGCFITAEVITSTAELAKVLAPTSAIIHLDDESEVIFVSTEHGFEVRPVTIGRRTREAVEVLEGLELGERYVASGGFILKAELGKHSFGDSHGH